MNHGLTFSLGGTQVVRNSPFKKTRARNSIQPSTSVRSIERPISKGNLTRSVTRASLVGGLASPDAIARNASRMSVGSLDTSAVDEPGSPTNGSDDAGTPRSKIIGLQPSRFECWACVVGEDSDHNLIEVLNQSGNKMDFAPGDTLLTRCTLNLDLMPTTASPYSGVGKKKMFLVALDAFRLKQIASGKRPDILKTVRSFSARKAVCSEFVPLESKRAPQEAIITPQVDSASSHVLLQIVSTNDTADRYSKDWETIGSAVVMRVSNNRNKIECPVCNKPVLKVAFHSHLKDVHNVQEEQEPPQIIATMPPEHPGFKLGGPDKCTVMEDLSTDLEVNIEISDGVSGGVERKLPVQNGWRARKYRGLDLDGEPVEETEPEKIMERMSETRVKPCQVTFEVDLNELEKSFQMSEAERKQQQAQQELTKTIGSAEAISESAPEEIQEMAKDATVQKLVVGAKAVQHAQVLIGHASFTAKKTAALMRDIQEAVKINDVEAVTEMLVEAKRKGKLETVLSQRDCTGNIPIHHTKSPEMFQLLQDHNWEGMDQSKVTNDEGETGIQRQIKYSDPQIRKRSIEMMARETPYELFKLEPSNNVCIAMTNCEEVRNLAVRVPWRPIPTWEDVVAALNSDTTDMLRQLELLIPGDDSCKDGWKGLLSFHVFGEPEIWKKGVHTDTSKTRLGLKGPVWAALERCLQEVLDRKKGADRVVRELLSATRGPRHKLLDPRKPYRSRLLAFAERLDRKSGGRFDVISSAQSRQELVDIIAVESFMNQSEAGLPAKLGLSRKMHTRFNLKEPDWVSASENDLAAMAKDLEEVGMIGDGALGKQDAAYDMLKIANGRISEDESVVKMEDQDVLCMKWYAAWLRGICNINLPKINDVLRTAGGDVALKPGAFLSRSQAKGIDRIYEKLSEFILAAQKEMEKSADAQDEKNQIHTRLFLRTVANLCVDILGVTFICDTIPEMLQVYERLSHSERIQVIQVKNGFSKRSGYRDLKIFVDVRHNFVETNTFVVEVQLMLRELYEEKEWSHLPYEMFRGSFDWGHLADSWPHKEVGRFLELNPAVNPITEELQTEVTFEYFANVAMELDRYKEVLAKEKAAAAQREASLKAELLSQIEEARQAAAQQDKLRQKEIADLEKQLKAASTRINATTGVVVERFIKTEKNGDQIHFIAPTVNDVAVQTDKVQEPLRVAAVPDKEEEVPPQVVMEEKKGCCPC